MGAKIAGSLRHYLMGVGSGCLAGVLTGYALGILPAIRGLASGLIRILRPIPPLAWIPFGIIWFGISHTAAAFIIFIGVFWITLLGTLGAAAQASPEHRETARLFGFRFAAGLPGDGPDPRIAAGGAHRGAHRPGHGLDGSGPLPNCSACRASASG
jgi:ABC-type nitrate/sulfonate/bicarbonate transport system permease component